MADFSPAQHQAREQRKIELAQAELQAQLSGSEKAPCFEPLSCPTEARERYQQRLAAIKALCAAVTILVQDL
ncbi:hypothetical protein [Hymenobacter sp. YC55]|uniref:hypothetical protein n=1 Tax=Hymenobacter sp. YC55 TaxID=3034019 RepID=UPI0023F8CA37|nr:hypothetical protein [Hymenobacter sp. YC55]MDF7815352.1 hypothetical protein [Hymenobacter sp. YC55]